MDRQYFGARPRHPGANHIHCHLHACMHAETYPIIFELSHFFTCVRMLDAAQLKKEPVTQKAHIKLGDLECSNSRMISEFLLRQRLNPCWDSKHNMQHNLHTPKQMNGFTMTSYMHTQVASAGCNASDMKCAGSCSNSGCREETHTFRTLSRERFHASLQE